MAIRRGAPCRIALAFALLLAALAALAQPQPEPQPVRLDVVGIDVRGLEEAESRNAMAAITLARLSDRQRRGLSEPRLQFLLRRIPEEVAASLEPFGWYSPAVEVRREPGPEGLRIVVDVRPGEPVTVRRFEAGIDGAAKDDRFIRREIERIGPDEGERFVHGEYEAGKQRAERKLAERGYFKARRAEASVEVRRAQKTADVRLRWDSGPRHKLGAARFGDNQFRPGLLAPLVNWQPGDAYHRNRLLRLQDRLTQLDYFALVEVVPDEDGIGDDLQVPIDIRTTPAKRTSYTGALSVGSDTGLGLRGAMNRRWVNERGHKWLADAGWSQRRIEADTQYRVPSLGRLPGWWSGELGYLEEDPRKATGFERTDLRLGWQGQRLPWTLGAGVVFARETKVAAAQRSIGEPILTLLYPEVTAAWREVDDPLWPGQARQLTATLRGGLVEAAGRREHFLQFELGANWLQTLGEAQRLVLRAAIGTTALGGDLDPQSFPTSLRYFAGGDRSIRGYGYRAVGPRIEGEVVGALHRVVASAEYQYDLTPQWGAAVFVDGGDAFDSRHGFEARLGAGIGARWRSPVGLVAIDLARGLDEAAGGGIRLHIGFGVGF